jgi:hypothetical protein
MLFRDYVGPDERPAALGRIVARLIVNVARPQYFVPADGESPDGQRTRSQGTVLKASITYVAAAVVSLIMAIIALRAWRGDLSIPYSYLGDATNVAAYFKTIMETGWYEHQPLLAAPFGQNYHDYKTADNLHMLIAIPLTGITGSYGTAMNMYFLAGFPLAAAAAVWFFRVLRLPYVLAGSLAVLFALAPYHFARSEWHLWLASYYPIPLALALLVLVLRGKRIWGKLESPDTFLPAAHWRTVGTLLVAAVVGSSSSYYAFVLVLLVTIVGVACFFGDRNWRRLAGTAILAITIAVVALLNMLPDMVDSWIRGSDPGAVIRSPGEVETYALKLAQLLLPVPGHRIEFFAQLRDIYDRYYPIASGSTALGAIAAVGVLIAGTVVIVSFLQPMRRGREFSEDWVLIRQLSSLTVFCLFLATLGGLGVFVSLFTSDLRGWDRVAIVIALLALGTVGLSVKLLVEFIRARNPGRPRLRTIVMPLAALSIMTIGVFDQTTDRLIPDYAAVAVAYNQDEAFVKELETRLPNGAEVLQLPYRAYPESPPINGVIDSDQIKLYLHSSSLRWSGGAIKGRPTTDWLELSLAHYGLESTLKAAALKGFSAVVIDRQELGADPDQLAANTSRILGESSLLLSTPRYTALSLDSLTAQSNARLSQKDASETIDRTFFPVVASLEPNLQIGFSVPQLFRRYDPRISITNPRTAAVQTEVKVEGNRADIADLKPFLDSQARLTVTDVDSDRSVLSFEWTAIPGSSSISLSGSETMNLFTALTNSDSKLRLSVEIDEP